MKGFQCKVSNRIYISVYTNHRPAFGLQADKLAMAFELLGFDTEAGMAIDRGDLLDFLQSKGVTFEITYPEIC